MSNHLPSLKIEILPASKSDKDVVNNLTRFYAYDMSEYMGRLQPGWEFPESGLYEGNDYSCYWEEPNRHSFLIRVNEELAGFVLINKVGSTEDVDWNMGEFFVVRKFTKQGVGRFVADWCFRQFPGVWEVMQMPGNEPAIAFWKKVIGNYTEGSFEESLKEIPEPVPHPMIVLKFTSS